MLSRALLLVFNAFESRTMVARNRLQAAPPYPVEQALWHLGANLRTARVRRNLTIANVAERIGTGPRAVMDAEKGKGSTGIAVFAALLWLYDLLAPLEALADPGQDQEGLARDLARGRTRARRRRGLDREF
jgi:transcriptional regulator with XRE-family HTH domain